MPRTYDPTGFRINARSASQIAQAQQIASTAVRQGVISQSSYASTVLGGLNQAGQGALGNANLGTNPSSYGGNTTGSGPGYIESHALDRLTGGGTYGATGESRPSYSLPEAQAKFSASKAAGAVTMGNTGKGINQGGAAASKAATDARNKAELDNAIGYVKKVNPKTGDEYYVRDEAATAKLKEDIKNRQAQEAAAGAAAQNAAVIANANNKETGAVTPTAPTDTTGTKPNDAGVTTTGDQGTGTGTGTDTTGSGNGGMNIPPVDQNDPYAAQFGSFNDQLGNLGKATKAGLDSINAEDAATGAYVQKTQDRNDILAQFILDQNQKSLDAKLDIAKQTHDAQEQYAEYERSKTESLYNRAIREQIISNEKARKDQLLGLGISGGWRASRQTANVIDALAKNDRTLANLYDDAAFANKESSLRLNQIEADYHNSVVDAYDKYDAANGKLYTDMLDKAADLDKTIFTSQKDRIKATNDLVQSYLKEYGNLAGDFAKTVTDRNKFIIQQRNDAAKFEFDVRKTVYDDAIKYVDTYGTSNKTQLSSFETQLGLPTGSLSSQKSLKELKLYGMVGRGGSTVDLGFVQNFVTTRMAYLDQIYGDTKSTKDKMELVGQDFDGRYGSGKAGRQNVGTAYDFLNTHYGNRDVQMPGSAMTGVYGAFGKSAPRAGEPVFIIPKARALFEQTINDFSDF